MGADRQRRTDRQTERAAFADALAASRLLAAAYPAERPCRVYHEVISSARHASKKLPGRQHAAWNGSKKLEASIGTLEQGQYQGEIWVQRALADHPWRVHTPSEADIIFLGTNVTLLCESGDAHEAAQQRKTWMNSALALDPSRSPAVVMIMDRGCDFGGDWGRNVLRLTDTLRPSGHVPQRARLAPYVNARAEMARDSALLLETAHGMPPWGARRLLHFVGHVPKFYINPLRMLIWLQVNREPDVTTRSHTLRCNLAPFIVCNDPRRVETEFKSFCKPWCGCGKENDCMKHPCRKRNANLLKKDCKLLAKHGINASHHLADLDRSHQSGHLPYAEYVREAASHRFCVVAEGDFAATPKLADFVLLGAAGGCIPLVAIDAKVPQLPYAGWIDWCAAVVIVSKETASRNMSGVLARLRAMTAAEAEARRRALDAIRDAFHWRLEQRPSAPDFALAEACWVARERANVSNVRRLRAEAMSYVKCMM